TSSAGSAASSRRTSSSRTHLDHAGTPVSKAASHPPAGPPQNDRAVATGENLLLQARPFAVAGLSGPPRRPPRRGRPPPSPRSRQRLCPPRRRRALREHSSSSRG